MFGREADTLPTVSALMLANVVFLALAVLAFASTPDDAFKQLILRTLFASSTASRAAILKRQRGTRPLNCAGVRELGFPGTRQPFDASFVAAAAASVSFEFLLGRSKFLRHLLQNARLVPSTSLYQSLSVGAVTQTRIVCALPPFVPSLRAGLRKNPSGQKMPRSERPRSDRQRPDEMEASLPLQMTAGSASNTLLSSRGHPARGTQRAPRVHADANRGLV